MSGPVLCRCGAVLVEETTERGVKPVGAAEPITFRRTTDYVICPECLSVYSVRALLAGSTPEESFIEKLERLAEEGTE